VGTFHTHRERRHPFYAPADRVLAPFMRRVALRVAVSTAAQQTVARYFAGDYSVIPNGIDVERFRQPGRRPATMPADRLHVLCVGRLEPRKGVEHLVDAMAILTREEPSVRLVVVGDGPDRERLQRRARAVNVDVVFVGRVADGDLASYYQSADLLCAPATGG